MQRCLHDLAGYSAGQTSLLHYLIQSYDPAADMHTEQEFIQLIGHHQKIIHKVCNLYMNSEQDKKDLFQEVLLSAWKGYRNFKGDAKFSTWLYRVALNTAITFYRKEQRQVDTAQMSDHLTIDSEYSHTEQEQLTAMYTSINALSGIDKALVMLYMEDYSYAEIGETMGITANNVAVKMNRIKTKLKESTKKYL
ncbi:MAG: RNA polymerase sigma factor [Chitinophagaceae bacterium]